LFGGFDSRALPPLLLVLARLFSARPSCSPLVAHPEAHYAFPDRLLLHKPSPPGGRSLKPPLSGLTIDQVFGHREFVG
jgi:hypothetical protein